MKKLLFVSLTMAAMGISGCVPLDDTYASCFDSADCADVGDQCLEVTIPAEGTFGAFCSYGCTSSAVCESNFGFGGACYSLEGSADICYQQCDFDSDCWSGSVCIPIAVGGATDFICVPDNL